VQLLDLTETTAAKGDAGTRASTLSAMADAVTWAWRRWRSAAAWPNWNHCCGFLQFPAASSLPR